MRPLLFALLLLAPLAAAQPMGAIDATVTLSPDAELAIDAPGGFVRLENATPGERYAFNLTLTKEYTTLEIRARGFDLERPKQLFPHLAVNDTTYPLFEPFAFAEIWDVDGAANIYHVNGTADDIVLRLGVSGPRNVTLLLERDVTPPGFAMGAVSELQHIGFYQETNTTEMAIADLQIREVGRSDWIQNPTPQFHVRQRFPIQGLDPDTEYEARAIFEDWSGNNVTSATYRVRTTPAPVGPPITITPLAPEPNATLLPGSVTIRARVESPDSPVPPRGVRVFFDKREVTEHVVLEGNEAFFTPDTTLQPGPHSVAFEAKNEAGGKGIARWTFVIEGAQRETPLGAAPIVLLALGVVALALARRR